LNIFFLRFIWVLTLACSAGYSAAQTYWTSTLNIENRSPVISTFAIARPDYVPFIKTDTIQSLTRVEISNYLSAHQDANHFFFIDGESTYLTQTFRARIDDWMLALSIPWIHHGDGIFDRAIYDFHRILGMPQNGRTDNRHDELDWRLVHRGQTLISMDSHTNGIGDSRASAIYALSGNEQLQVQVKLPTGSFKKQTGSDAWDAGFSYSQQNPDWLASRTWLNNAALAFWWGTGLTLLGHVSELDALDQNRLVLSLRSGLGWQMHPSAQIKVQLDANSPLFDSDIRELGWVPVQASIGGEYAPSDQFALRLAIVEDLRPRVTPDVVFLLELQTTL